MKFFLTILISVCFISNYCFADDACDFSKDIVKQSDGTYKYSEACDVKVGQLVQDNKTKDKQIADYKKAISLKDLAITTADERTQNWIDTSIKMETYVQKEDSLKKDNQWIWFVLGVVTVGAAEIGVNQLRGH